jgi:hypothetical protein
MSAPAIMYQACVEIITSGHPNEIYYVGGDRVNVADLQMLSRDADQYRSKSFMCSGQTSVGMFAICLVDGHWVCAWHTRSYDEGPQRWVGVGHGYR